jgi:hypothetical protein
MNIGTQTNSLVNSMYSRMTINAPAPTVGMGATRLSWTDRHAATVTKVAELTSKVWAYEIHIVEDKITVVSGSTHDGSAVFATHPTQMVTPTCIAWIAKRVHGFAVTSTE